MKLQVRQCKVAGCGAYISGVFDTCIEHSGLTLSNLTTGTPKIIVPVVKLTTTEKKKLKKTIDNLKPAADFYWLESIKHARYLISLTKDKVDKRDGTCRLVYGLDEVYDIEEDHELLRLPFSMSEVEWDATVAQMLYEQYIIDNFNLIFELVSNKTIGTFVPVKHSKVNIILTLIKQIL